MSEISLSPVGKEQIHKLETILLVNSILRPEVLEELKNPEGRITWVDSLAVAAAALARERAKMTVSQIAEELGRTEATIRNHLQGKTRAGQIVRETYERIAREGADIILPEMLSSEEISRLKDELEKEKKLRQEMQSLLEEAHKALSQLLSKIDRFMA
ncbi:MAG TPA: transcriptional regulator [Candidatus Bathyarchaeota archaeon]|nr:transcriptional regulator [Candidatus Bathyarchaeota archaeon]